MAYTDAGSDLDFGGAPTFVADFERAFGAEDRDGVVGAGDAEVAGEAAGATDANDAADKDAAGRTVGLGGDVEAIVHAVDQIDIGVAGRAVDDFGAGSDAAGGVGGFVGKPEIGFDFDDRGGQVAVDEHFAQQSAGDGDGVAVIE